VTAALLGLAWAAVIAGGVAAPRPVLRRARALGVRPRRHGTAAATSRWLDIAATVAAFALAAIVAGLAAAVVVAGVMVAFTRLRPAWLAKRIGQRRRARIESELPEVVDLLILAVGAGLTVPLALDAVERRATGELRDELAAVLAAARQGHRLADALDALPSRAGEGVRPLVAALVASERYGAPLQTGLERLADEVRAQRRRRADIAARRVSVKLLFPLVVCILPAFALLTVAPLIASALESLRV
jgi:tight adherence protein C